MRIAILNRSLEVGGAQVQMAVMAKGLAERGHDVIVLTFYPGGRVAEDLIESGIRVVSLNKSGRWDLLAFIWRLRQAIREISPDLIYAFLPVPNLFAALFCRIGPKIVWGVRASQRDLSAYDWTWRLMDRLEGFFSNRADLIICNSNAGMTRSLERGFPKGKTIVIHNGIDVTKFDRDVACRDTIRKSWGIDESGIAIGIVGRLDPVKRHDRFIRAIAKAQQEDQRITGLIIGSGVNATYRESMKHVAEQEGCQIVWIPEISELAPIYSALDTVVSCSSSEGFPNVAAEALACGTPVLGTRVGDMDVIVPNPAWLVDNADDGTTLARAILGFLASEPCQPEDLREHITTHFTVERMIQETEGALCRLQ